MSKFAFSMRAVKCLSAGFLLICGTASPSSAEEDSPAKAQTLSTSVGVTSTLVASTSTKIDLNIQIKKHAKKALAEHPLEPILKQTSEGIARLDAEVKDYSCILVKRERINGRLQAAQYIKVKIRHEPFSVYLKFLGPKSIKGRECLYVKGKNNDKLIAHEGQGFLSKFPSVKIDPTGSLAMDSQRYPITEIGIRRLAERIHATITKDCQHEDCEVKIFPDTKIKDRDAYCIQVTHLERQDHFSFHKAQVFVDKKLGVPLRYVGYMWPKTPGGDPVLDEEYTYLRLKINNNFTDEDFDPENKKYNF